MNQLLNIVSKAASITNNTAAENARASFTLKEAQTVARMFSSQIQNKAVPLLGSKTGNYVLQEQMQSSVGVISKVVDIGLSFAINPIVGAFVLASEGADLVLDAIARNREIMWQNRNANELARRAGYLSDQNR